MLILARQKTLEHLMQYIVCVKKEALFYPRCKYETARRIVSIESMCELMANLDYDTVPNDRMSKPGGMSLWGVMTCYSLN